MTRLHCASVTPDRPFRFEQDREAAGRFGDPTPPEPKRGCFKGPISPSPAECRTLRSRVGWSRERLAREAGLSKRTVFDFESGARTPHPRTLIAIRRAFRGAGAAVEPPVNVAEAW